MFVRDAMSNHAEWIAPTTSIQEAARKMRDHAIGCLPVGEANLRGNWDVLGLRATGSIDYQVPPQTIQSEFTVERVGARQQRGGPFPGLIVQLRDNVSDVCRRDAQAFETL